MRKENERAPGPIGHFTHLHQNFLHKNRALNHVLLPEGVNAIGVHNCMPKHAGNVPERVSYK
jgi:hypothetical protein